MMSDSFRWLDDERLADATTSTSPVWLFALDGTRVLWANLAAARLMGHAGPASLMTRRFDDPRSVGGQIAGLSRILPLDGAPRLQRLRFPLGAFNPLITCHCQRLRRADGDEGIMTTALDGPAVSGLDAGACARALVTGASLASAVLDGNGHVLAASDDGGRFVERLFGLPEVGVQLAQTMQVLKQQRHAVLSSSLGRVEFRRLGRESDGLLLMTLDPEQALARRHHAETTDSPETPSAQASSLLAAAPLAGSELLAADSLGGVPLTPEQSTAGLGVDGADLGDILAAASEVGDGGKTGPATVEPERISPATPPSTLSGVMPPDVGRSMPPAPDEMPTAASAAIPRRTPLRFVFGFNAAGHLSALSGELGEVVGASAHQLIGRSWPDIATRLGLDPDGRVAQALARRDTWSGITVHWPVDGTNLRLPVDLAAMPLFGSDRRYEGLRGFGVCRDLAMLNAALSASRVTALADGGDAAAMPVDQAAEDLAGRDIPAEHPVEMPAAEESPTFAEATAEAHDVAVEPAGLDEDDATESAGAHTQDDSIPAPVSPIPPEHHRPTLSVVPQSLNVVPFRVGEGKRPTLTPVEQQTFREIARQLGVRIETDPTAILENAAPEAPAAGESTAADAASTEQPPTEDRPAETSEAEVPPVSSGTRVPTSVHDALALLGATVLKRSGTTLPTAAPIVPRQPESRPADGPDTPISGSPPPEATLPPTLPPRAELPLLPAPVLPTALIAATPVLPPQVSVVEAPVVEQLEAPDESLVVPLMAQTAGASAASPAALQQSLSAALIDKLPLGVLVHRGDDILFANSTLLEWTGYSSTSALKAAGGIEHLIGAMTDAAADKDMHPLALMTLTGQTRPVDARLHSIPWDGRPSMAFVFSAIEPEKSAAGPVVGLAAAAEAARIVDQGAHAAVIARQEAETSARDLSLSLRESESRVRELSAILDTATDGVLVLDRAGTIRIANRSAEALFGIDSGEMISHSFLELLAPESHGSARDYLDGLTANGVRSLLNDGREVIGKVHGGGLVPLFMTMGRVGESPDSFCVVLRDVTAFKRAEDDLMAAKQQAETANAQKSDFLAKISHEIRTPLNAIIGFSEVMMEERFGPVGNERYREYLRDIHASGGHVLSLVNDLLDLSKIEAGKLDLTFTSVDLNDLIQQCVAIMQPQANRERTIIRTALARPMPNVVADSRSVRQIVLNLLSNSIKFTPAGGQVIVSTAITPAGEAVVRVRDTGVGMSDKDIATALEPFRQVATSSRFSAEGTGLGLPLTKALAEANRATFTIKSAVGQGTLVEIAFPPNRVLAG